MAEKVPRLVAGVDIHKYKLDATDGFLLTRIDGRLGTKDLSRETGLPDFTIDRALEKLEKLGVIERIDPNAPPTNGAPKAAAPEKRSALAQFSSGLGDPKYDPTELEEDCDLPKDQRKKILDVYYRLDDLDHYTLLGVTREADKKTVKRAYFELAAFMHPDKYFKKNLGSFKAKMEVLFNRITEAHDTLVDAAKRMDYDAYIDEVASTRGMEAMFERALEEAKNAAPVAAAADGAATGDRISGVYQAPGAPSPLPPGPLGNATEDLKARREALARRLLGGNTLRPPSASATAETKPKSDRPSPQRYTNSGDAIDALKRRYEQRIENATVLQAKKYVQAGEEALAKKDVVAAASAFSIAVKFDPGDAALAMRYQEVKNDAEKVLCESYEKQAAYEERSQHWQEAARSWQKVAKIKVTDAKAHERVAHCMLKYEEADLQVAAEHAKAAVGGAPDHVANHVTLAEIYMRAGLKASAKRAAETGLKLDAKNAALLAILKKASK